MHDQIGGINNDDVDLWETGPGAGPALCATSLSYRRDSPKNAGQRR